MEFDGYQVHITKGRNTKSVPIDTIGAVQIKRAGLLVNGYLALTIPGSAEHQTLAGSRTAGAAGSDNAVVFTRRQAADWERFYRALQTAIAQRRQGYR